MSTRIRLETASGVTLEAKLAGLKRYLAAQADLQQLRAPGQFQDWATKVTQETLRNLAAELFVVEE